jgi:hypothetical protein
MKVCRAAFNPSINAFWRNTLVSQTGELCAEARTGRVASRPEAPYLSCHQPSSFGVLTTFPAGIGGSHLRRKLPPLLLLATSAGFMQSVKGA